MWLAALALPSLASTEEILGGSPGIFVRSVGDEGPVIVLVHGGPGAGSRHMRSMEKHLVPRGYRVVTWDQRGTGASGKPTNSLDFRLQDYVDDLERVRRWTGEDRVIVLGHSWGGIVAMAYAGAHPEHLAGLVVADSPGPDWSKWGPARKDVPDQIPPPPAGLPADCVESWPGLYSSYVDPSAIRVEDLPADCSDDASLSTRRAIRGYDLAPALADVRVPTLIVFGAHDWLRPNEVPLQRALAAAKPTTAILDACGHRPMFECPAAFYEAFDWFAANQDGRRAAFREWAGTLGTVVAVSGHLPARAADDDPIFAADVCSDGRAVTAFELADGRRWTARPDAPCTPTEPRDALPAEWSLPHAGGVARLGFHLGRPFQPADCTATPLPASCPAPGDLLLWDRTGDPPLAPAGFTEGTTDARFDVLVYGADGGRYEARVSLPRRDAVPNKRPRPGDLRRYDHLEIWLGDQAVAVVVDHVGAAHVIDRATGGEPADLTVTRVGDAVYLRPAAALGRALTIAFADSDGRRITGRVATAPLADGVPAGPGRVYEEASRWEAPPWVTAADDADARPYWIAGR